MNDGTLKVNNTTGSGTGTGAGDASAPARRARSSAARWPAPAASAGLITVQEGGSIAPGNSIGTLTAAGGLTLQPNSVLTMELAVAKLRRAESMSCRPMGSPSTAARWTS